jgi:arsenate reductase (glutaredoxin)
MSATDLPDPKSIEVTIYHNPDCGTSRNTLALIRNAGVEPKVIEYLKTPPSRETLAEIDPQNEHAGARSLAREGHALWRASARRWLPHGR